MQVPNSFENYFLKVLSKTVEPISFICQVWWAKVCGKMFPSPIFLKHIHYCPVMAVSGYFSDPNTIIKTEDLGKDLDSFF